MKLAIQIVTYFSSSDLDELLRNLSIQTFADWKLFVYENSCDRAEAGRVQAALEASGLSHHFFISDRNTGFDGGHQALFVMHDAPFVLLLNMDVKLESTYLEQVMKRIESNPKIGSVSGLIYRWRDDADRVIDTAGLEYRCLGQIADRFANLSPSQLPATSYQLPTPIFGVSGAIGLYRRSAIESAGGLFNPSWFMYKEDADLALRLKQAGFVAWFEPSAVAWHKRGLKEEGEGIWARLKNERSRSPILRTYSYANQWRIYRRHWKTVGWRDRFCTIKVEFLRSLLVFIASPRVFIGAWLILCFQK